MLQLSLSLSIALNIFAKKIVCVCVFQKKKAEKQTNKQKNPKKLQINDYCSASKANNPKS